MARRGDISSDDSDDYYGPRASRGSRGRRGRGRNAKTRAMHDINASKAGPSQIKLKVKAGGNNTSGKRSAKGGFTIAGGSGKDANVPAQWQGYIDRELDSDTEEPLVFEEAFILRMPVPQTPEQVSELTRLTEMVQKRETMDEKDVWFKFMDSRRAVFNLGKTMYSAKLVDLPCLVESHKTIDSKHIFKTADISQMLLVENPIPSEQAAISTDKGFNIQDYIYPHGITPPMRDVRIRRFRPRLNKQTIEIVERQVERLIAEDQEAEDVQYELVDESEIQEGEQALTQAQYEADLAGVNMALDPSLLDGGDTAQADIKPSADALAAKSSRLDGETSANGGFGDSSDDEDAGAGEGEDSGSEEEDSEAEGYDSDLAAMIEGEIGGQNKKSSSSGQTAGASNTAAINQANADASDASGGSDDEGDSDDLFGKGRSDDDEDEEELGDSTVKDTEETFEAKRRVRLMADEMKDLENAVSRKKQEVARAPNPIIKRRFEDSLKKLSNELELKKAQHAAAQHKLIHAQQEIKKALADEEAANAAAATDASDPNAANKAASIDSAGLSAVSGKADPAVVFGSSSSGPTVTFSESTGQTDPATTPQSHSTNSKSKSRPKASPLASVSVLPSADLESESISIPVDAPSASVSVPQDNDVSVLPRDFGQIIQDDLDADSEERNSSDLFGDDE